jgi:multidrug resistance efflux pump
VKVVQRVPVKITLDKNQDKEHPLRAGMNVKVVVKVK